ncbi:unnamed protein product [Phytophthora lilii]|uniref:Unnamed protein product n=1 Tax=Phytophthora lilii TaxID=2077276 RepID=A0A9W6XNF6_9STRA|nr:unnamed protein product [Phytophthora lilii]
MAKPTTRFRSTLLLSVVALLACVPVASVAGSTSSTEPTSQSLHSDQHDVQAKRQLRSYSWEVVDADDNTTEERALEKFTTPVKNLAEKVKLKMTSDNQQATNKLFEKLNLGAVKSNVFESPQFQTWTTKVTKAYKKKPELGELAMVATLRANHDDDVVAGMITAAKDVSDTKTLADKLEEALLKTWAKDDETVDAVFKLLKLDQVKENLLQSPSLSIWAAYVTKLGKNADELLFAELKARYKTDEALASMLVSAKETSKTHLIAKRLEEIQLQNWLKDGKTAGDAFKILELNKDGNLFENTALITWVGYVRKLDKERSDKMMFAVLQAHFSDKDLARKIIVAKANSKTEGVAEGLELAQVKDWITKGMTTDKVFKILGLDNEGEKLLESPALRTLMTYFEELDRPRKTELLFSALKSRYDEAVLTTMIRTAMKSTSTRSLAQGLQGQLWLSNKVSADEAFKLLKLEREGTGILESPNLRIWISYVAKLSKNNKYDSTVINKLETSFGGDMKLARVLYSPDVKTNGVNVQILKEMQFKDWAYNKGVDPRELSKKKEFDLLEGKDLEHREA